LALRKIDVRPLSRITTCCASGPSKAKELLMLAEEVRSDSFDLQQFTSQINQNFDRAEKLEVMETLWRIIYADGVLDKFEDALARQLAALLRLSHREAIDLKLKVLEELRSGT
jgi:uncharacterized tellurite resistance protein B-like protein